MPPMPPFCRRFPYFVGKFSNGSRFVDETSARTRIFPNPRKFFRIGCCEIRAKSRIAQRVKRNTLNPLRLELLYQLLCKRCFTAFGHSQQKTMQFNSPFCYAFIFSTVAIFLSISSRILRKPFSAAALLSFLAIPATAAFTDLRKGILFHLVIRRRNFRRFLTFKKATAPRRKLLQTCFCFG